VDEVSSESYPVAVSVQLSTLLQEIWLVKLLKLLFQWFCVQSCRPIQINIL
jgi:hypothetical protein